MERTCDAAFPHLMQPKNMATAESHSEANEATEHNPRDWGGLPVLQLVGAHLAPSSLRSARLACSHWRCNAGYGLQHYSFDLSRYKGDDGDIWAQKLQRLALLCPCVAVCELTVWNTSDRLQERLPLLLQTFPRLQQVSLSFRQGVAAADLVAMVQLPLLKQLTVRSERCCSTSFLPALSALTQLTQLSLSLYCCERDPVEVSLCTLAPLRQLRHFSITKRHDYNSCYVSMPWSRDEAKTLAQAWPHLESLELHLNVLDLFMAGLNALNLFSRLTHLSIAALESFSPGLEWVWVGAAWLPTSLKSLALDGVVVDVPAWSSGQQVVGGAAGGKCWNGRGWSTVASGSSGCVNSGGGSGGSSSSTCDCSGSSSSGGVERDGSSSAADEAPAPPSTPRLHRSPNASIDQLRLLASNSNGGSNAFSIGSSASSGGYQSGASSSGCTMATGAPAYCAAHASRAGACAPVLMQSADGRLFYMPAEYMPAHSSSNHKQHSQQQHQQQHQQQQRQQQQPHVRPQTAMHTGTHNVNNSSSHAATAPQPPAVLPALRCLRLDSCRLEDAQLWRLAAALAPTLQHLEIAYCRGISDRGLCALALLAQLRSLEVTSVDSSAGSAGVSAAGLVAALGQQAAPQLTSLRWVSEDVTFEG